MWGSLVGKIVIGGGLGVVLWSGCFLSDDKWGSYGRLVGRVVMGRVVLGGRSLVEWWWLFLSWY